jgi:hypothetical protein
MKKSVWLYGLLAVALVIGSAGLGRADVNVGDMITKDNMAEAEDFLIPTEKWMLEHGLQIKVGPYKKIEWPKAYKEATEKYSGQVKISADGREIFNLVAGMPFPNVDINDPLAGYKAMWNMEYKPSYIDNVGTEWIFELVNDKGEIERTFGSSFWRRMMWTGRMYHEPKPVIPHNPPLRFSEQWGPLFLPSDLKGAGVLNFRYMSPDVPDDSYMYLPELRRVRRISVANRSDALWGSDFDIDMAWVWNAKLGYWTFRVLALKEFLVPTHLDYYGTRDIWCVKRDGQTSIAGLFPCWDGGTRGVWQKRKQWVIEAVPTGYSQYAYSKRIVYLDADNFLPVWNESYDQAGELWRTVFPYFSFGKKPYDSYPARPLKGGKYNYQDDWPFTPYGAVFDLQAVHGGAWDAPSGYTKPSDWRNEWYFNEDVRINTPRSYTISYLIQSAR